MSVNGVLKAVDGIWLNTVERLKCIETLCITRPKVCLKIDLKKKLNRIKLNMNI